MVRRLMKYFGVCGNLVIILVVLWCVRSTNLYAAEKDAMEKSDEIEAFEEFLDGNRKVFFEIGMRDLFQNDDFLTAEMLKHGALLEDILKQVNECLCQNDEMATLTYAYIDCCKDGKTELAIRFGDLGLGDYDEWAEEKKPDWKPLENSRYRKYVKEIELAELRKERYTQSNFDLKGKWVTCNVENYYEFATVNFDFPGVDYFYQNAIEYSVADYSKRAGIPKGVWKLTDIAACGNGFFAVSLKSSQLEQERYLCLLFDNDALKMGIEERTHYIVAADLQQSEKSRMTCDSMLDWESYADSPAGKEKYSYTIYRSKEDFFENTSAGERSLNWYLKNTGADKGSIWELDLNAICSTGNEYEYISILRFTCGNEEVVMALDENNETYAVI